MTLSFKHSFVSAKGDPVDTSFVRPSDWNAEHAMLMATGKMLGRSSNGTGAVEELDVLTFFTSLGLGVFSCGDVKFTTKTSADTGWVMMSDGTIGDASSGATVASDDNEDLWKHCYDTFSNSLCAVSGGRTSRDADWSAHKTLALTKTLGRALAVSGSGSGLTARTHGSNVGTETHVLSLAETPAHTHGPGSLAGSGSGTTSGVNEISNLNSHHHNFSASVTTENITQAVGANNVTVAGDPGTGSTGGAQQNLDHGHNFSVNVAVTGSTASAGSGSAHANMQPTVFLNCMIKQ